MPNYEYVVIVGCGRLGSILANRLSGLGSSVVVIDEVEAAFENLSTGFSGFKMVGDATELAVLRQAKTDQADCFLATTRHDNINLMVAQVAKTVFKVPKVMARIFNPAREVVYRQFGIETISPTKLSAEAFLQELETAEEAAQL
ncbi:MAG: TrkA family potassium uptake protein [Anaerolineae bacterium]|nr:TrkA family potassium uptake protein [Anaerolineae bacterium]